MHNYSTFFGFSQVFLILCLCIVLVEKVRGSFNGSLDTEILLGWWSALFSDILIHLSMRAICGTLHRDIVGIWNMNDPEKVTDVVYYIPCL
jgi:hypothetical protein